MATIYDDIPVIQEPTEENSEFKFLGFSKVLALTQATIAQNDAEKVLKQKNWMLTTVEQAILKAAEEGQYSTTINVPIEYSFDDCVTFLTKEARYKVNSLGNRSFTISWNAEPLSVSTEYIFFDALTGSENIVYAGADTIDTITLSIPKGTVITAEYVEKNFPAEVSYNNSTYDLVLDDFDRFEGPGHTSYGTTIYNSEQKVSVYYLQQK